MDSGKMHSNRSQALLLSVVGISIQNKDHRDCFKVPAQSSLISNPSVHIYSESVYILPDDNLDNFSHLDVISYFEGTLESTPVSLHFRRHTTKGTDTRTFNPLILPRVPSIHRLATSSQISTQFLFDVFHRYSRW